MRNKIILLIITVLLLIVGIFAYKEINKDRRPNQAIPNRDKIIARIDEANEEVQ